MFIKCIAFVKLCWCVNKSDFPIVKCCLNKMMSYVYVFDWWVAFPSSRLSRHLGGLLLITYTCIRSRPSVLKIYCPICVTVTMPKSYIESRRYVMHILNVPRMYRDATLEQQTADFFWFGIIATYLNWFADRVVHSKSVQYSTKVILCTYMNASSLIVSINFSFKKNFSCSIVANFESG